MQMQQHLTKSHTFSTVYPLYSTPDGRKWIIVSIVEEPASESGK